MKTRELIKKLFKADPVGDQEVCVGNLDINFVENVPAYYDGAYQVIERDSFGRITGGKYIKSGNKVQINTLAICDILEHDNVVISYKELLDETLAENYKISDEKTKQVSEEIKIECEYSIFKNWAEEKARLISGDPLDLYYTKNWFKENISYKSPIIQDPSGKFKSYKILREREWDLKINLEYKGLSDWEFSWKNQNV